MTDEQRAVLAHVLVDPDAWYAHAVEALGEARAAEALAAKVARWQPLYDQASAAPGYLPRAQRPDQEPAPLLD